MTMPLKGLRVMDLTRALSGPFCSCSQNTDAIGNELLFPVRHGQNERMIAVGRRNWTFAGSDAGGHRAAAVYTLIETALCRARHRAVYAARRTMPSWVVFPRFLAERRLIGSA